jgi:hypothetical protein
MGSDVITIERPRPPDIVARMAPLVDAARAFRVENQDSHGTALERIKKLRTAERELEEWAKPTKQALLVAKRQFDASVDQLSGPIAEARRIYDESARGYEKAEEARADAERRRLQEEARKKEEERQILEAIEAEDAGDHGTAEAILAAPVETPVVHVAPRVAQVEGVSSRTLRSAEFHLSSCKTGPGCGHPTHDSEGVLELVRYVAEHPEWLSLLEVDRLIREHPNLNRLAVSLRDGLRFPGVRAVTSTSRATRT